MGLSEKDFSALEEAFGDELWDDAPPDGKDGNPVTGGYDPKWKPKLNQPTQQAAYDDKIATFILAYGERGSGKTLGCGLHKLIEHCFLGWNALALIVVREVGQASDGGAWSKLETEALPTWRYGNKEIVKGEWTGKMLDNGMGLEYTDSKLDAQTKKPKIWIRNRHGGWSLVLMISLPVAQQVIDKLKGKEPSFILVDEAQTMETDTYFVHLIQQLGRRPRVGVKQQAVYCCNPAGPKHWLYKRFWEMPWSERLDSHGRKVKVYDKKYARYHVPFKENRNNLNPDYIENVMEAVRGDPIEEARMIRGEWIDRPLGTGLFVVYYSVNIHIKGSRRDGTGLIPHAGHPIIVGMDLGQVHHSISFMQWLPTREKNIWTVFDEIYYYSERILFKRLSREILERMDFWSLNNTSGGSHEFTFEFLADDSATTVWHPGEGSSDAWDIERHADGRIKIIGWPKPKGSVATRVRIVNTKLHEEEIAVSARCEQHQNMFEQLEDDGNGEPIRGPFLHPFDSMSGPIFMHELGGYRNLLRAKAIPPKFYACGTQ